MKLGMKHNVRGRILGVFAIPAALVMLSACAGPITTDVQNARDRARSYVAANPSLDEKTKATILRNDIRVGMNKAQVLAAWGRPEQILKFRQGRQEQWIFGCDYPHFCTRNDNRFDWNIVNRTRYETRAIFEDGVVASFRP